jgi:hypothetical protein
MVLGRFLPSTVREAHLSECRPIMAITVERRRARRITPQGATAVLVMEADKKWMTQAAVVNLSTDGGLIGPASLVATGRRLGVLFEGAPDAGWIDAAVVGSEGPSRVGIRFVSPLSDEFVSAAASGFARRQADAEAKRPYLGDVLRCGEGRRRARPARRPGVRRAHPRAGPRGCARIGRRASAPGRGRHRRDQAP